MINFKRRKLACCLILWSLRCLAVSNSWAQAPVLENNPSSIRWKQVVTPSFQVIFPNGFDREAQRVANILEHVSEPVTTTFGNKKPKKISIVLQNQNSISNGFVALGPRRSEFQTTAPQDYNFIGTNRWLELLAIHEYRHVVQFSQSRTGWNKIFSFIFGQNTQAGMAFTSAPPWFWEGDATVTETILTPSGRGRIPAFDRIFRTNLLEGKRYNYNKQHLRSYKDFVPNHYVLGYLFTTHIRRRKQDAEVMHDIANSAWSWPFVPFTFSNSMKRHTGMHLVPHYNTMMDELETTWQKQLEGLEITGFESMINRKNKTFTDYSFPQVLEDGSVIAMKSGIAHIEELVKINADGTTTTQFVPGIINDAAMLSSAKNKVAWTEFHFDPRWRAKTYSVIKWYDFSTGEKRTVTRKSRYAAAALSPDGLHIATILNSIDNQYNLVVIDANNGLEKLRFDNPGNMQYGMPRWSDDGREIVVLKTNEEGKAVVSYSFESGEETLLLPFSHENIGHPVLHKGILFYNSPYNGIDNIYAKDLKSGETFQVTSSRYGAYNPAIDPGEKFIYYNDHTVNGLDVVKMPYDRGKWKPITKVEDRNVRYFQPLVEQENQEDLLLGVPNEKYPVKKYSKIGHMINVHSWGPFASTDLVRAEAGIFSRDVLSNTNISLGYVYDIEEESGFASAAVSYQAWFPIIDMEYQFGNRSTGTYRWEESTFLGGLRVPLLLTSSKYFSELSFSNSIGISTVSNFRASSRETGRDIILEDFGFINDSTSVDVFLVDTNDADDGSLVFNDFEISFTNVMKQSARDINSRFGQFLVFNQLNTLSGDFNGATTGVRGGLFFPGLFTTHSFFLRGGYQNKEVDPDVDTYSFRNIIFKPRGYSFPEERDFTSLQVNYAFPLWNADLDFGPFLNIRRVKANFFYDYGRENVVQNFFLAEPFRDAPVGSFFGDRTITSDYNSYGLELTFDVNIMRFTPEVEIGARILNREANNWNTGGTFVEFILGGVNF